MSTSTNLPEPMESLEELTANAPERIAAAATVVELDEIELNTVGKQSPIAAARRGLGSIDDPEARRAEGRRINDVATALTADLEKRRATLAAAEQNAALAADAVDVTLPGRVPNEAACISSSRPWTRSSTSSWDSDTPLRPDPRRRRSSTTSRLSTSPKPIPSRMESDTLYLDYGRPGRRDSAAHPHLADAGRYMEEHEPPVYVVVPGRCLPADAVDATHLPVFHQIEGLAVDENITFGDLKGTLAEFARRFFGRDTKVKFIPHYFPFTEPSAEMHAYTNGQWLELLGCGMVNPAVFEHVGYDPESRDRVRLRRGSRADGDGSPRHDRHRPLADADRSSPGAVPMKFTLSMDEGIR